MELAAGRVVVAGVGWPGLSSNHLQMQREDLGRRRTGGGDRLWAGRREPPAAGGGRYPVGGRGGGGVTESSPAEPGYSGGVRRW
jgi:hypothetical protein